MAKSKSLLLLKHFRSQDEAMWPNLFIKIANAALAE